MFIIRHFVCSSVHAMLARAGMSQFLMSRQSNVALENRHFTLHFSWQTGWLRTGCVSNWQKEMIYSAVEHQRFQFVFFFSSFAPELFNCSTVQRFSLIRGYIIRLSFSQKNNFCAYLFILSLVSIRNQSSQHQKIHTRAHEHQLNRFHTQNHIIFRFNYSIVNLFVAHEPFFFSILLLNPAVACRSQVFCDVLGR